MTTLQITLEESVADVIRIKAQQEGKTPETLAAEIVSAQASALPLDKEWINKFLQSARQSSGNSHGWKWNRNELYDR